MNTDKGFILVQYNLNKKQFLNKKIQFKDYFKDYTVNKFNTVDFLNTIMNNEQYNNLFPIIFYKGEIIFSNMLIDTFDTYFLLLLIDLPIKKAKFFNKHPTDIPVNMALLDFNHKNLVSTQTNFSHIYNNVISNINKMGLNFNNGLNGGILNAFGNEYSTNILNAENLQKYSEGINKMKSMGFTDVEKIVKSLIISNGILEEAINIYMIDD